MHNLGLKFADYQQRIQNGEVIACAAEGVWGLSCDAYNYDAVQTLLQLKQREVSKGLIMVVGSLQQFINIASTLSTVQQQWVEDDMNISSLTTWLVNHQNTVPDWVTGKRSEVALRITKQPQLAALCVAANRPLISTSANPSALSPAMDAQQVAEYFPQIAIVKSEVMQQYKGRVSQLRSLVTGEIVIAR